MSRFCAYLLCLFFVIASCKKKEEARLERAKVAADVGTIAFPSDVVAFVGVKSFDRFVAMAGDIASKFNPTDAPMIGAQIPALLQGVVLRVKNLGWLDGSRVVRIVFLNPDAFEKPSVLILPIKGKDLALQALPDDKVSGAPQNEWRYTTPTGLDVFVNFFGNFIAFSFHEKAFLIAKPFFEKDLQFYDFNADIDAQASLVNMKARVLKFLDSLKSSSRIGPRDEEEVVGFVSSFRKMLSGQVEALKKLVEQTETVRLVVNYDSKDIILRFGAKVASGSELEKFVLQTKDRKFECYKELPKDSWVVLAQNIDPSIFGSYQTSLFKWLANALSLREEDQAKVTSLLQQLVELQTGDHAFGIYEDQGMPIAMMGVTGVKDGEKAKTITYQLSSILLPSFGDLAKKSQGSEILLKDVDFSGMTALVNSLKPILAKDGINLFVTSKESSGVQMDVLSVEVTEEKVREEYKPMVQAQSGLVGNKVEVGLGFGKQKSYFVFARDVSKVRLGEQQPGAMASAILNKDYRVAQFAYISVTKLFEIASRLYPPLGRQGQTPGPDSYIVFTVGAHDERIVDLEISLPIAFIGALVAQSVQR